MTKAGEKWLRESLLESDERPPYGDMFKAMEFGICAIFAEIERESKALALANSHGVQHDPNFVDISDAFAAIKAKFGIGDPPKGGTDDTK